MTIRKIKPVFVFLKQHYPSIKMDKNVNTVMGYGDRLVAMNIPNYIAFPKIRDWFMRNRYAGGFYTNMFLINDMVAFEKDTIEIMLDDIKMFNYPVLCANVEPMPSFTPPNLPPPSKNRFDREFRFVSSLNEMKRHVIGDPVLVPALYSTIDVMCIRSDLIGHALTFENDSIYNNTTTAEGNGSEDVVIAHQLHDVGFRCVVDIRAKAHYDNYIDPDMIEDQSQDSSFSFIQSNVDIMKWGSGIQTIII